MTDDLDLSEYERDVVEHVLVGRARSRMFEALHDSAAWSIALDGAEIEIGGRARRRGRDKEPARVAEG